MTAKSLQFIYLHQTKSVWVWTFPGITSPYWCETRTKQVMKFTWREKSDQWAPHREKQWNKDPAFDLNVTPKSNPTGFYSMCRPPKIKCAVKKKPCCNCVDKHQRYRIVCEIVGAQNYSTMWPEMTTKNMNKNTERIKKRRHWKTQTNKFGGIFYWLSV